MNRCRGCATVWDTKPDHCPHCGSRNFDTRYAPSALEDQYRAEVRKYLSSLSKRLSDELSVLARRDLGEDAYLIDFEVHSYVLDDSFPVHWFAMDEDVGQGEEDGNLLDSLTCTIPRAVFRAEVYAKADLDVSDTAFRELVVWFADCWERAGGHACRYPAYIQHHDSGVSFDLRARRWVRNREKWPDAD